MFLPYEAERALVAFVEAQKIEERRVIIDRHAIDYRADEFATATLDRRQGEPVDQREAVARAVRVFDAVDQHHVVGAVFGALPMIGDPLSAVGGKSVAVQPGEMADVDPDKVKLPTFVDLGPAQSSPPPIPTVVRKKPTAVCAVSARGR